MVTDVMEPKRPAFWVTEAACANYRDILDLDPNLEMDDIVEEIDSLVTKTIKDTSLTESIRDMDEDARIVQIRTNPRPVYALVKLSTNKSAEFAVVTVLTQDLVERKWRTGQWTRPGTPINGLSIATQKILEIRAADSSSNGIPRAEIQLYMLTFHRSKGRSGSGAFTKESEVWPLETLEKRLDELYKTPNVGQIDVWKRIELRLRIEDK